MYTTIKELINRLEELQESYGEDMPIAFSYDYGDHCRSQAVRTVNVIDEVIAEDWQGGLKRIITGDGDCDSYLDNECKNCLESDCKFYKQDFENESDYQKILILR